MNIDWSKAPEGTTGAMIANFFAENIGIRPGFVEFIGFDGADGREVYKEGKDAWTFVAKPSAWNGEGLPPVGAVCECQDESFQWHSGTIVHVGQGDGLMVAVMQADSRILIGESGEFRPIRTPEQIAAEEREKAVIEMLYLDPLGGSRRGLAEALYDHGYRKQEQTK